MNFVGRLTLWNGSLFLAAAMATAGTALLWLILLHSAWGEPALRATAGSAAATVLLGMAQAVLMFGLYNVLVPPRAVMHKPLDGAKVHVAITSYNDQEAVGLTVREFRSSPWAHQVVVADNMSADASAQAALAAGADRVVLEPVPGYGSCCAAALAAAADGLDDDDVLILVEGDCTFSALGLEKLLAYLAHCDLVLGTRTTQELREVDTQLDWLINPGNQVAAKLTQLRFWGTRLSDVGCTYRALRVGAYRRLRTRVRDRHNLFGYEMLVEALKLRMRLIEVPVVFRPRVGQSKGVGSAKLKAAWQALRVLYKLYTC
jgi:glycosyltransferase involved in cell wall biosynthesis